jgi:hydrogenase-4 component F
VLHALNNGLAKGLMFLTVGNVVLLTGTSATDGSRGLLSRVPASGVLLIVGLLAVTGSPPFGMFLSEFAILSGTIGEHHPWVAVAVGILLTIIFVGMAGTILEMVYAPPLPPEKPRESERRWLLVAPAALALLVLGLGVFLPVSLRDALSTAATALGGYAP